jgi:hypothetical protein
MEAEDPLPCSQSPPPVPTCSQKHPVYTFPPVSHGSLLLLSYHQLKDLRSGLFPSGFSNKILKTFLISHMHATCPVSVILLDLITVMVFCELRNKLVSCGEEVLAPRPTLKVEHHLLSVVRECLFSIFAATLHGV